MKKNRKDTVRTPESVPITEKDFQRRMTFSLLAILACVAVMASSTFALFHTEVSSAGNTLTCAYYTVEASDSNNVTGTAYKARLAPGDEHTFFIKAQGTASTGYCKIQVGNDIYYTPSIPQGETLTLTVIAAAGVNITITPVWGTSPVSETPSVSVYSLRSSSYTRGSSYTIEHSHTPYVEYTVEPTARLADIAEYYGVEEEDILSYNGITELSEGEPIKIPGVDSQVTPYHVPVETEITESETTAEEPETTTEEPEPTTEEPEPTTEEPEPTTEESEPTTEESETTVDSVSGEADSNQ